MNHPRRPSTSSSTSLQSSILKSDLSVLNNMTRRISSLSILLAIIYSTALNLSPLLTHHPDHHHHHHHQSKLGLPSLPLRHSSLTTLLPHIIFESILISRLSHSSLTSFGACLHLLKIPLLSTTYRYFKLDFKTQICRSLTFDLINYLGQFLLFYFLSSPISHPPHPSKATTTTNMTTTTKTSVPSSSGSTTSIDGVESDFEEISHLTEDERIELDSMMKRIERDQLQGPHHYFKTHDPQEQSSRNHHLLMSLLTWILISLVDGSFNFVFERGLLSHRIQTDVQAYTQKLELDQFFLLKSSGTIRPTEVLRTIEAEDLRMLNYQLISPLINLPYGFSSASLISLPSDFILLDRLPMLSINTKTLWLLGLILRRLLNSGLAYFFKT